MPLPATMRCIEIAGSGGPEVLRPATRPLPVPGPDEVLIEVAAAGVNRPDVLQRKGLYPVPPGASDLPGLEVAGTVVAVGPVDDTLLPDPGLPVPRWSVGDRVVALLAGGGYAQYVAAPALQCLPWPEGLEAEAAAALPETCFTVWDNLFTRGRLKAGERVLIHGGTSGIGTTAIQLARCIDARVLATAGGPGKARACEEIGAERGIDYRAEDFVAVVKGLCGGVDVILDMVGGPYLPRNLEALDTEGRLVQIAFLQGAKVEVNLERLMRNRLTITGSTLRARTVQQKGLVARAVEANVWPLIAQRRFGPVIHASFPLAAAAEAHGLMESSAHIGKIVLVP
ncbi:MAG: NAD(P)H-quinone oxidoreductase [Thalassobaculales bacterium]